MPRRSGGGARPAPSRPTARPSAPTPQQARPASTQAMPGSLQKSGNTGVANAQQQASQGPGLFGQMASTAAGVAVGSSIGHAIGGFFGGGSSAAAPAEQSQQGLDQGYYGASSQQNGQYEQPRVCGEQITQFRQCMDGNQGDLNICGWYLDQLKACQQAASKY